MLFPKILEGSNKYFKDMEYDEAKAVYAYRGLDRLVGSYTNMWQTIQGLGIEDDGNSLWGPAYTKVFAMVRKAEEARVAAL